MENAGSWLPWRVAWERALYGPDGFYRRQRPADHFRTSVHASGLFAEVIVAFVRRHGLASVTDFGAGSGELVSALHRLAPDLDVTGVDLRPRPAELAEPVRWSDRLPSTLTGLLLANELLDNVPCDVVELDRHGKPRLVEVCPASGAERLGGPVPVEGQAWLARWWPLIGAGDRAEIGLSRDEVWQDACRRLTEGIAVAVDYGHLLGARPPGGTLTSYRAGRQRPPTTDSNHDLTAHVALDAVAARVGGHVHTQRDVLADLGFSGRRPELALATTDPAGYLRALSRATHVAELTGSPGFGDFGWVIGERPVDPPALRSSR